MDVALNIQQKSGVYIFPSIFTIWIELRISKQIEQFTASQFRDNIHIMSYIKLLHKTADPGKHIAKAFIPQGWYKDICVESM